MKPPLSILKPFGIFVADTRHRAVHLSRRFGEWVVRLRTMSTEVRILWLTFATVVLAAITVLVAFQTLGYMHRHDSETDTRSGWAEIHKAMVSLRVQRTFVLAQRGAMGAYGPGPNQFEERQRDYILATAQLRGQLDRLNDEPLLGEIARFLEDNKLMEQWETDEYEKTFDGFADKVAMKARPK